MSKKIIKIIESSCVPLPIENIDTDLIFPSRFLKETKRVNFGDCLFGDWRFDKNNKENKDFVLNKKKYGGKILAAGKNFGCGSSREHAAWALKDYGFDAIIATSFADIFRNNALNNNLLPIQVSPKFLQKLFDAINQNPKTEVTIDLPRQEIFFSENCHSESSEESRSFGLKPQDDIKQKEYFEISAYKKECFTKGHDDIGYLLGLKKGIEKHEKRLNNFKF